MTTSNLTISIDPGYRYCGVAIFNKGVLEQADLVEARHHEVEGAQFANTAQAVWEFLETKTGKDALKKADLAIEYPQQYTYSPAPREAVQRLVGTVGAILSKVQSETGGLSVRVSTYKPQEWKGQVPKDIMSGRILARLTEEEIGQIPRMAKAKLHNVMDSIGVGLYHLKRLRRKRVSN